MRWLRGQAHLYDAESLQCFTPSVSESHHTGGINQVRCAADGKQYATAGKDGTIRLWDIVTSKCVATLDSGHDKMVSRLALRRSAHSQDVPLIARTVALVCCRRSPASRSARTRSTC